MEGTRGTNPHKQFTTRSVCSGVRTCMSLGLIHATHGRVAILGWMPVECGLDPDNKNLREVKHSQKGHEEEDRAWQIKGRAGVCCKLKPMD